MTTLFDAMLKTAENLRGVRYGVATSGSSTTLVDTAMNEPDEWFDGGTLFILSGFNKGVCIPITSWDKNTHTFTIPQIFTISAGTLYAAIDGGYYTREDMIRAINQALLALGPFDQTCESLLTASNTEVYELPDGVEHVKIVEIATAQSEPYEWGVYPFWREDESGLHFQATENIQADRKIRITYEAIHQPVDQDLLANLIGNSDFETNLTGLNLWNGNANTTRSNEYASIGSYSCKVSTTLAFGGGYYGLSGLSKPAGTTYTFSVDVFVSTLSAGSVRISLRFIYSDGTESSENTTLSAANAGFVRKSVSMAVPSGKTLSTIYAYVVNDTNTTAVYYFDGANLSITSSQITDTMNIDRLAWEAAFYAALNRSGYAESSEPNTKNFLALANQMRTEMRKFPVRRRQPTRRMIAW